MISYKFYKQVVLYTYLEQILVFQNILSVSVGASPNVNQAKEFLQFSFFFFAWESIYNLPITMEC